MINEEKINGGDKLQLNPVKTHKKPTRKVKSTTNNNKTKKLPVDALISRTLSTLSLDSVETMNVSDGRMKSMEILHSTSPSSDLFTFPEDLSAMSTVRSKARLRHINNNDNSSVMSPVTNRSHEYSIETETGRLTTKEMMRDIERRAKKNLAPPNYVLALDELAPVHFAWNKKASKARGMSVSSNGSGDEMSLVSAAQQPAINIIGCLHPLELILACADKRSRQQNKAMKLKKKKCDEKTRQIHASIEFKFSRAERYAAILERKQRQVAWMKIIVLSHFMSLLRPKFQHNKVHHDSILRVVESAACIQRFCRHWYQRHLFIKIHMKFLKMMRKNEMVFKIQLRIRKKRIAVKRFKTFLLEYKMNHQIPRIVHKYLQGVRKVQACMRDFLQCKRAKVIALGKIWTKLEIRYIKRKLDERKAQKRGLMHKIHAHNAASAAEDQEVEGHAHIDPLAVLNSTAHHVKQVEEGPPRKRAQSRAPTNSNNGSSKDVKNGGSGVEVDSGSRIEMKQQAKLWNKIDSMMETKIQALKASGVIVEENEMDAIKKLMLSDKIRDEVLMTLLESLRKEFYTSQKAVVRRQMESDSVFSESHAIDLLLGRTADLNRIIAEKFDKKLISMTYKPFYLFQAINSKMIYDKVRETHRREETFKIKIDRGAAVGGAVSPTATAQTKRRMQRLKSMASLL